VINLHHCSSNLGNKTWDLQGWRQPIREFHSLVEVFIPADISPASGGPCTSASWHLHAWQASPTNSSSRIWVVVAQGRLRIPQSGMGNSRSMQCWNSPITLRINSRHSSWTPQTSAGLDMLGIGCYTVTYHATRPIVNVNCNGSPGFHQNSLLVKGRNYGRNDGSSAIGLQFQIEYTPLKPLVRGGSV
jgi:hypothetical protein